MPASPDSSSIGLVLSGGGARGAYEVGVLLEIADKRPDLLARVRVISGSSVGAVNAAYLAARGLTPASVSGLADLWRSLEVDRVLRVAPRSVLRLLGAAPLRLMRLGAKSQALGLLDARGLWRIVAREIDWGALHANVVGGRFDAVAITATDISSGHTHVFFDSDLEDFHTDVFTAKRVLLGLRHVLASAAIPLLFTPIQIDGRWYMDGGVRQNTPLSPALALGAHSLLVVTVQGVEQEEQTADGGYPGVGHVVGKLLDSIFLDRVTYDVDRLARINDLLEAARELGPDAHEKFLDAVQRRGRPRFRNIPYCMIGPREDLGRLAAMRLRDRESRPLSFLRVLEGLFENDPKTSGDAASYLLFDKRFAARLIELGRSDAGCKLDELAAL